MKRLAVAIALCLIGAGLWIDYGTDFNIPGASWFHKSAVEKAVIVEESSERPNLPQSQVVMLQMAETIGVAVIDKDVKGKGKKKTPDEFVAIVKAVEGKPLPQLVRKWSTGRTTAVAAPKTFDELKEAVK